MSAIDELKSGIEIDAISGEDNSDVVNTNLARPKQIVKPKSTAERISTGTGRKTVNVIDITGAEPSEAETDPNLHKSVADDILNMSNPDSPFAKYVSEKEEEAKEWLASKAEEDQLLAQEAEYEKENPESESDINSGSSFINDEYASETTSTSVDIGDVEEINIGIEDDSDNEDNDEAAEDNIEIASNNSQIDVEMTEPESYDAPDIDLDVKESNEAFTTEINDDEDEATESEEATTDTDVLKHLQQLATERLKPASKKLDISSFTVVKKPVTNVTPIFNAQKAKISKWVLSSQKSIVLMKEFSGSELEALREYSENSRSLDSLNRRFHMIYDHIVSPKPANFETWLKTTPYSDVDNYMFAIYVASFNGANYLPEDCINDKCKETFITDNVDIMSMVKFDTKEAKQEFQNLYQSEASPASKGLYVSEVVPLNNNIAIGFREPSIYNIFELVGLDEKTRSTYSSILEYIPYIDDLYVIDTLNETIAPIGYKLYPDNAQRTVRSKLQKYQNVFNTLSVDEFGPIKAYVRAIAERTSGIRYVYPAVTCPKCGTLTNEIRTTAEELVFTRYQLGALTTTSLS